MRLMLTVAALCLPLLSIADEAPKVPAQIPLSDFARYEKVSDIRLSPDGKYIAESRLLGGEAVLAVIRLSDMKITAAYNFSSDRRIENFWWVGPERLILTFGEARSAFVEPLGTGELIGVDADDTHGGGAEYLYGQRGTRNETGTRLVAPQADDRWATVIQPLTSRPDSAVIQINDFPQKLPNLPAEVDRIDVNSGKRTAISYAPVFGETDFLTDHDGNPIYAVTEGQHFNWLEYSKAPEGKQWNQLNKDDTSQLRVKPIAISKDDHRAFLLSEDASSRRCVVEHDLQTNKKRTLSCDDQADATGIVRSFDGQEVIAALYEGNPPWERLVDTSNNDRAILQKLMSAFPGQIVLPISRTLDGSKAILFVYSDRNPGDYYLFDPKTMKADYLESAREWIDPDLMAERRPIQFKARDGQLIHGFLTLPRGAEAKNLPLVVDPHGGPFGPMDRWSWDADAQMLASRGYAVLQVNFRGSGGYGQRFIDEGQQSWNSVMINDITDGTRWSVQQGIVDPRRICIYGGSYGGYAAMMSAVREPDLYRCVIGYAGIYDLVKWKSTSDVSDEFIYDFVGTNDNLLAQASPINYIDKLKAAVMIVHGEADKRVPFDQAKALRAALEARHYPYEWMTKADEGHGFFDEKNRAELYERMIAFLDKNIGTGAESAKPSAISASEPAPSATH